MGAVLVQCWHVGVLEREMEVMTNKSWLFDKVRNFVLHNEECSPHVCLMYCQSMQAP